jgi:hypothetical protein
MKSNPLKSLTWSVLLGIGMLGPVAHGAAATERQLPARAATCCVQR